QIYLPGRRLCALSEALAHPANHVVVPREIRVDIAEAGLGVERVLPGGGQLHQDVARAHGGFDIAGDIVDHHVTSGVTHNQLGVARHADAVIHLNVGPAVRHFGPQAAYGEGGVDHQVGRALAFGGHFDGV